MLIRTPAGLASSLVLAFGTLLILGCEPPETAPGGGWRVVEQVSPMDDSPGVLLTLAADEEVELGDATIRPRLVVECVEGATVLRVEAPGVRVCTEMTSVTLRFDKNEARTEEWLCTDDHRGVGLSSLDELLILREMEAHDRMLVRFRPSELGVMLSAFDIREFRDHLPKIKKACDWR